MNKHEELIHKYARGSGNLNGPEQNLLPMAEAAKLTPYSAEYLSLRARRGKLPATKIDGVWYAAKSDILAYMEEQLAENRKHEAEILQSLKSVTPDVPVVQTEEARVEISVPDISPQHRLRTEPKIRVIAEAMPSLPQLRKRRKSHHAVSPLALIAIPCLVAVLVTGIDALASRSAEWGVAERYRETSSTASAAGVMTELGAGRPPIDVVWYVHQQRYDR